AGAQSPVDRDARPRRGREADQGTCGGDRHPQRARAAVDPDAGSVVVVVPAALALVERGAARAGGSAMIRSYAVVTPARDEAENLPRLAASLAAQTTSPPAWN